MSNIAIKVENLSKAYQLGQIGTGTISRDLERWFARVRGKEDPFLRIGETNDQNTTSTSDIVWSLKDISFEIQQGDAVGIIGRNGAGKSTLLKILSKVTAPTAGKISGHGRIASLLEVGTGFHPELSGRENIFLNGAILGMRKKEVSRKLDEIVAFAGIERYLDTPVKRYSSGMYVRLAFAVAAHLESEILIVDEVLAVGDAEFQKKCLGKMGEVSKGEGRTVLFVSHNTSSILTLTNKCIYLQNGELRDIGDTKSVINHYLSGKNIANQLVYSNPAAADHPSVIEAQIMTTNSDRVHICGEDLKVQFKINVPYDLLGLCLSFQIVNAMEIPITYTWVFDSETNFGRQKGTYTLTCVIPKFKLYKGKYDLTIYVAEERGKTLFEKIENVCNFEVEMPESHIWGWDEGVCAVLTENIWKIEPLLS